ncbi:hypothetical protein DAPPUDRAFT_99996 [Daphnia pulex]|uniref:Uncharacterized protein n=1 Tax=Daphnia pulex TaxID=6669 RepID=E9G8Z7_DAPPU|nr:hypothetical protein DAPPUDRAFT_99996 [Daphnia pulex]|eukprot:EFX84183.1 hypothetical protein DAPPUDRAFT_99996 [Daphnia pulex]
MAFPCDFIDGHDSPVDGEDGGHGRLPTAPRHGGTRVGRHDVRRPDAGHDGRDESLVHFLCGSNPGRLRPGRAGNDGAGHAQDPDCTQQGEDGLDGRRDRCRRQRHSHDGHQRRQKEEMAGRQRRWPRRPSDGGQCHVLVAVVAQSDGRRSGPAHFDSPPGGRPRPLGRRSLRFQGGPGRRPLPPARHRGQSPARTGRLFLPGQFGFWGVFYCPHFS